jgi:hypothetical protein
MAEDGFGRGLTTPPIVVLSDLSFLLTYIGEKPAQGLADISTPNATSCIPNSRVNLSITLCMRYFLPLWVRSSTKS